MRTLHAQVTAYKPWNKDDISDDLEYAVRRKLIDEVSKLLIQDFDSIPKHYQNKSTLDTLDNMTEYMLHLTFAWPHEEKELHQLRKTCETSKNENRNLRRLLRRRKRKNIDY